MPVSFLFEIAMKATAVLLGVWAATQLMSRATAATRHLVWTVGLGAVLALPLVVRLGPDLSVPVLKTPVQVSSAPTPAPAPTVATGHAVDRTGPGDVLVAADRSSDAAAGLAFVVSPPRVERQGAARERSDETAATARNWPLLLTGLWAAGMTFFLLKLAAGLARVAWIQRRAVELTDPAWRGVLEQAAQAVGLHPHVSLLMGSQATVPVTWGIWKPKLMLPPDAARWTPTRRRVVLLHELAHVKRRDCLVQVVAQVACALHWFNPLVFVALSRLRREQERACDDIVLASGISGPEYADHLLDLAGAFRTAAMPGWVTLAMARPSQLEGRVLAILDDACSRRPPRTRVRLLVTAAAVAVVVPLGALRPSAAESPAQALAPQAGAASASTAVAPGPVAMPALAAEPFPSARPEEPQGIEPDDFFDEQALTLLQSHDWFEFATHSDFDQDWDSHFEFDFDADEHFGVWVGPGTHPNPFPAAGGQVTVTGQAQDEVTEETRRRVADALVTALDDENQRVREQAINSLIAMRDERVIPGLVRALRDPSVDVRERSVRGLLRFESSDALDGLLLAVKDESPAVREQAVNGLGRRRDPAHVDTLAAALQDENAGVREQAVAALGRIRGEAAAVALARGLADPAVAVRERAVMSLGRLRSTESVPALIPLLTDADRGVRENAARALGMIRDPRAIDPLTAALKDAEPSVRERAAYALGEIARAQRRGGLFVRPPRPARAPMPPEVNLNLEELQQRAREAAEAASEAVRDLNLDLRFDRGGREGRRPPLEESR